MRVEPPPSVATPIGPSRNRLFRLAGRAQCLIGADGDERVEDRLRAFDARERGADHLHRRDFSTSDPGGKLGSRKETQIVLGHAATLSGDHARRRLDAEPRAG
jgi:hypothetical protein